VEGDPAAGDHALEYLRVVGHDFWRGSPLVHTRLWTAGLQLATAQRGRDHAVELGCLVQPDERIGVEPVTSGAVAAIDHGHVDVGVVDEGIHESHACGTGADDQIVGLDHDRPVLRDGALG
jgi:hypothetical protein